MALQQQQQCASAFKVDGDEDLGLLQLQNVYEKKMSARGDGGCAR